MQNKFSQQKTSFKQLNMKTIINSKIARIIIISVIILIYGALFAQANTTIKGQITDKNNQPVPYATATVINPQTMEIVEGDMADENGNFYIENVKPGTYILSFRMVGFNTNENQKVVVKTNTNLIDAGKIPLQESVIMLGEINVTPVNTATGKSISQLN